MFFGPEDDDNSSTYLIHHHKVLSDFSLSQPFKVLREDIAYAMKEFYNQQRRNLVRNDAQEVEVVSLDVDEVVLGGCGDYWR